MASADKILSLYEGDLHVIVQGKGRGGGGLATPLFLAEQRQDLVVDRHLYQESASSGQPAVASRAWNGAVWLPAGVLEAVGGDRGTTAKANQALLAEAGLFNRLVRAGWQIAAPSAWGSVWEDP
ncbi:MAG: hypothetical protein HS113_29135 [Verrucomicrobiales bacterium]|nr:hypothetical protein [Verrucomicrobiales bacterium]